jgi:uncharacterized protein (DUF58 family)
MPFCKWFAVLIASGIIPILAGSLIGAGYFIFFVYNILLVMLLIFDLIITPSKNLLEVERVCDEKFSLGVENKVIIKVRNNSDYKLDLEFMDEIPLYFNIKENIVSINALPHEYCEGEYIVTPEKRGRYSFGNIHCRYNGILKLCRKSIKINLIKDYKVYPNLKDLRKFSLSAYKKSQLALGIKKEKVYSIGTEFESLREYCEGDDYRKINWMATARADKLVVNTYEPEKNQQVFIMIDTSRVMNSEINFIKKLDYAINSAFLLADFAIKKGDNTGLLVFDSEVKRYIKPGKGTTHFQLIAENLYNAEENFVSADYQGALVYLNEHQKRRSLLCIFTELFNSDEAMSLALSLKNIAKNHIPFVITIKDLRIYEIANNEIKNSNDVFLRGSAIKSIEEREKIRRVFQNMGIACMDIPPDELSIEVLNKYLNMKSMLQI